MLLQGGPVVVGIAVEKDQCFGRTSVVETRADDGRHVGLGVGTPLCILFQLFRKGKTVDSCHQGFDGRGHCPAVEKLEQGLEHPRCSTRSRNELHDLFLVTHLPVAFAPACRFAVGQAYDAVAYYGRAADVQVGKSFAKALQLFFDPLRCDTVFGYLLDIYFVKHYLVVIGLRS